MRPSIVLFGDSITEESFGEGGWGAHLANHYSRSADVVLRGYSGYNTRWASLVAGRAISSISGAVAAVTVLFGANDASLPDRASAFQHVPLPEYRDNLRAICAMLRARWPSAAVILITPPPVNERGRVRYPYGGDMSGLPERTNEVTGRYARACMEVARQAGLRVIDIWSRMQKFPGWETSFLRDDGLHLTPLGNRLLFEEVVFALRDANLSLEVLPADLPLCSDIDPNDAVKYFQE
ncbi:GDSL esterase/lipase At5g45920-like [Lolium perenne]|uniref:GDSL esterase/lipase At5g45920-like n=1 Tax=Lolium perenne TaxID=4522 RepID=UPI0021EACDEE|nr:GDSL esterase/lipase At5g45920-like [Lolium perenne]